MNKYETVFTQFAPALEGDALTQEVNAILERELPHANTPDVKRFLHGTIDMTTLSATDTETKVVAFVARVNELEGKDEALPNVAAICVYPCFVGLVRETLTDPSVRVACVSGGFPASQTFQEIKVAETALALAAGTDEVDIVLNLGAFLDGNYEDASFEIEEIKHLCEGKAHLKVIIESGALSVEDIRKATLLSLYSGADFVKTSTGKEFPGASLEAAYTMCRVLKEYYDKHGERRGIKFSGGIRTTEDALRYYCIVKAILGEEWLTPELMRIGASGLLDNLHRDIFAV